MKLKIIIYELELISTREKITRLYKKYPSGKTSISDSDGEVTYISDVDFIIINETEFNNIP